MVSIPHNLYVSMFTELFSSEFNSQSLSVFSSMAGVSRSTSLVAAYIMAVTQLNWREALKAIKCSRSIANPNYGFQRQLQDFWNLEAEKVLNNYSELLPRYSVRSESSLELHTRQKTELHVIRASLYDLGNRTGPVSGANFVFSLHGKFKPGYCSHGKFHLGYRDEQDATFEVSAR